MRTPLLIVLFPLLFILMPSRFSSQTVMPFRTKLRVFADRPFVTDVVKGDDAKAKKQIRTQIQAINDVLRESNVYLQLVAINILTEEPKDKSLSQYYDDLKRKIPNLELPEYDFVQFWTGMKFSQEDVDVGFLAEKDKYCSQNASALIATMDSTGQALLDDPFLPNLLSSLMMNMGITKDTISCSCIFTCPTDNFNIIAYYDQHKTLKLHPCAFKMIQEKLHQDQARKCATQSLYPQNSAFPICGNSLLEAEKGEVCDYDPLAGDEEYFKKCCSPSDCKVDTCKATSPTPTTTTNGTTNTAVPPVTNSTKGTGPESTTLDPTGQWFEENRTAVLAGFAGLIFLFLILIGVVIFFIMKKRKAGRRRMKHARPGVRRGRRGSIVSSKTSLSHPVK